MTYIADNLRSVRERLEAAARRAGRDPAGVRLVAVSKTIEPARIQAAIAAGQRVFGENYLQEAQPKIAALGPGLEWHLVGHLQSNKAKKAAELFSLIHSVDRAKLARALNDAAARLNKIQDVLVQVQLSKEETKFGVAPAETAGLLQEIARLSQVRVLGLMTMPPFFDDPEAARPFFRALRELRDELVRRGVNDNPLPELSMGMTGDFEAAVEEGATLIRVGTAIFGQRP
jgi:pyridoxal phosphate enzyme (YggS family)